ncbi:MULTISPECIES: hypothetical protein [Vibrio]|uniref:hypothetical protein n=1 Tax=Vibrio TaxID=662 RepID=UPI00280FB8C7|nr:MULTISPECIES: hypothetical protein [unclassified Vibrio]ELB2875804.1 hypothetical protein [Vibrio alginolyticus]MDW1582856.1 hypothetical protein [Vibrio sp. Vb2897]MDW1588221.1 hypothetical protein [Vibrio sp. Vb2910]MDW1597451.1 hypothetical protein [Vibrio sp. Vb2911]MDW1641117.1 hypothetical protein [Vibrio sp. Vb2896]
MNSNLVVIPSLLLLMTACSNSVESMKYANEGHLLNQVSKSDEGYFIEYQDSFDAPTNPALAKSYLDKGVLLTDIVCSSQLNYFANIENNSRFSQSELGVLVVLATGIMGINGASQDSFTKLALGGAAVNSSIDLYRNHYLLGPDSDVIISMVNNARQLAREKLGTRNPETFSEAFELLRDYSEICTDNKIRQFVRQTIEKTEFEVDEPIIDIVSENALTNIALILDRSGLSNEQYIGLFWKSKESPKNPHYVKFIDDSLGSLKPDVDKLAIRQLVEIKQLFLRAPSVSAKYQKLINETKLQLDKATDNLNNRPALVAQLKSDFGYSSYESDQMIKEARSREEAVNIVKKEIFNTTMRKASRIEPINSPRKSLVVKVK